VGALRRELPERERPFRLPFGDVIPLLAFYAANMIVYWAGWETNQKLFIAVLIGYVVLVLLRFVGRRRHGESLVNLDFRIGAVWLLPWFAAMALISWLFDPATHPNLFNWVFLINAVVAVAVYFLAMRFRLPKEATLERVKEAEEEARAE
jgi:amino acid transporter